MKAPHFKDAEWLPPSHKKGMECSQVLQCLLEGLFIMGSMGIKRSIQPPVLLKVGLVEFKVEVHGSSSCRLFCSFFKLLISCFVTSFLCSENASK
jgi:hypothetical protein